MSKCEAVHAELAEFAEGLAMWDILQCPPESGGRELCPICF